MADRPKRRKYKDNPYTLNYIEEKNIYIVSFKDVKGKLQKVEVSEEVYRTFDRFELQDLAEMNEYDRHIEHSEIFENNLEIRAKDKPISLEDSIIRKATYEELINAIKQLPIIQQKRIKLYYFDELSTKEIAEMENCTQHSVRVSLRRAVEELGKILKK